MNKRAYLLALALCLPLTACDRDSGSIEEPETPVTSVTGSISIEGLKTLPASALVEISLVDVSRQDARAKLVAKQRITKPGPVPIEFELSFNPRQINELNSYAVQAKVTDRGSLLYVSDTHTPVLTRGAGNHADIKLVGVKSPRFGDPAGLRKAPASKGDTGAAD